MPRKEYTIHYIYKTVNLINGKFYIGMHSTFDLDDGYLGSGKRLWYSIKKHGRENFVKKILEFCKDRTELKCREKKIVNEDMIHDPLCMNLMIGGEGGWTIEIQRQGAIAFKNKLDTDPIFKEKMKKITADNWHNAERSGKIRHDTSTGRHRS